MKIISTLLYLTIFSVHGYCEEKLGIYLGGETVFQFSEIKWHNDKNKDFQALMHRPVFKKCDFLWLKRGYYIVIYDSEKKLAHGYEWRPFRVKNSGMLLPVKFKIKKDKISLDKININVPPKQNNRSNEFVITLPVVNGDKLKKLFGIGEGINR